MQQATCAYSGADTGTSSGNLDNNTPLTRRGLLSLGAIAASASVITAGFAVAEAVHPRWEAFDWLTKWHRLGCGARLDGRGNLQLTPRSGVEQEACALLCELNEGSRMLALNAALAKVNFGCAATRAVERIEQIDREFVSDDDDEIGHAAWFNRWSKAYDDLANIPAKTGYGLAGKLRQGMLGNGSQAGERIVGNALRQLERWA